MAKGERMKLVTWLYDWRRGYTDADIASAAEKMSAPMRPGQWTRVTREELKVICDHKRSLPDIENIVTVPRMSSPQRL